MDASPWGVMQICRVLVRRWVRCDSSDIALSPLVTSDSSSLWYRLGRGFVCTPFPDRSAHRSSRESGPRLGHSIAKTQSIVLWPDFSPQRLSMGDSRQEGSPLTGMIFHPCLELRKLWVWLLRGLIASGLSTEVAETILQSRAPSMRKLYALKLRLRVQRPPAWSS